ncbi:MAG: 50S ribosomal protein L10 [Desulfatitalea sp. BRH_c12]|jgi:large subunit ribosomal protein L10|nr:MAG: 50S ribosomal protein L10 [Desulfatitalea sp. BRH_c12]
MEGGVSRLDIEAKKKFVVQLRERMQKSKVVIVTDFKGLDVGTLTELRDKLREVDVEFQVIKNTILRRASEGTGVEPLKDHFKGPSAIAISYSDPVAPAKVLSDFAKTNEKLEIKIGVIDGKLIDLTAIKALAALPSREQLLATVLSAMIAVPTSFVRALNDVPRRMVNVLQAIKDQKESQAA